MGEAWTVTRRRSEADILVERPGVTGPVVIVRVAPPFDEEAWNEAQRVAAYYAVVGEERERAEKAERERDIGKAFLAVEVACHEVASREAMDARSQLALAMHWGRELVDHHEEHATRSEREERAELERDRALAEVERLRAGGDRLYAAAARYLGDCAPWGTAEEQSSAIVALSKAARAWRGDGSER